MNKDNIDIDRVDRYFEEHRQELRDEFIRLLRDIVAERTVNVVAEKLADFPYLDERGEETKVANIVREWAGQEGFRTETHARIDARENIILHYGADNGPRVLIPCHSDVVPPGDGWNTDPFRLQVEGDLVRGRGVMDDKGPLVASLLALKTVKQAGIEISGDVQVGALADEEAMAADGTDYGLIYMLENGLIKADYAIVPDIGGNMEDIDIAEKGIVNFEIRAVGKQAHGSTPEKGINAIDNMAEYLVRLKKHEFEYAPHPLLGNYTLNVGEIRGGAAANIVAGECKATIDMRLLPDQSVEAVKAELIELAEGLEAEFEIEVKMNLKPHEISADSKLITSVGDAAEHVRGKRPQTMGLGGGTYAKFLNHRGIEAVGFSPGDKGAMHMADEYASISEHLEFAHVLAITALKLASSRF